MELEGLWEAQAREWVITQEAKERVRPENTQKLSSSPNTCALVPSKSKKPKGPFISTMAVSAGDPGSFPWDVETGALNHCISWEVPVCYRRVQQLQSSDLTTVVLSLSQGYR